MPFHLRSVGVQTSAELLTAAYALDNPFYKNDKDFHKGDEQMSSKISLSTMETVSAGPKVTGGTITPKKMKKKKNGKLANMPDCFDKESINMHYGKGGDGFEAWKGSGNHVMKKQKMGKRKEEIKNLTKDGMYGNPLATVSRMNQGHKFN